MQFNRRDFLRGAAAGSAAMVAMSTLTAAYMPSGGRALRTFANQTDLYVAETSSGGWGK